MFVVAATMLGHAAIITLAAKPGSQTIKGWGCFIGGPGTYGGINEGPAADAVFSLGITTVRVGLPGEAYVSGTNVADIVLDDSQIAPLLSAIQMAQKRGVSYFMSIWSPPPVWKLPDHVGFGFYNGQQQYLDPDKVQEYCNFYTKALLTIQAEGGGLPTHISIQNEPNVPPDNYDGCSYHPVWNGGGGDVLWQTVITTMRSTLDANGLSSVKIQGTDDGQPFTCIKWLNLFGDGGFTAFDANPALASAIGAYAFHSYGDFNDANWYPTLNAEIKRYPKDCWMTEWNDGSSGNQLADAINATRHFATDFETLPYTHWVYWIGVGWEYGPGDSNGESLIGSTDGTTLNGSGYHKPALIFKKIWNIVRPNQGWRVKTCTSDDPDLSNFDPTTGDQTHLISFYKPGQSVVLIVNDHAAGKTVTVQGLQGKKASLFQTTAKQDMAALRPRAFSRGRFTFTVPANSVVVLATN